MTISNKIKWSFLIAFSLGSFTVKANVGERCLNRNQPHDSYSQKISAYVSLPGLREFLKPVPENQITISSAEYKSSNLVDLQESPSCQEMSGFGFALTESTVLNMNSLEPRLRTDAMKALFDTTIGAGFNYLIVPLTSTDFNDPKLGDFSVCDCKEGENTKSGCFNPSRLAPTLQVLKQAQTLNPQLQLMLKPWTAPPHMKSLGSVKQANPYFGGSYDSAWTPSYSKCLAQSVRYFEKNGFKVKSIAVQNEPGLDLPYPSTYMNDDDHAALLNKLSDHLRAQGSKVQLIVRADNFIAAPGVQNVLRKLKPQEIRPAFAAHCYSNDPQTPKMLTKNGNGRFCSTKKNHELEYLMGECTASAQPDYNGDFNWWMENRVLGDIDLGATAVLAWNGLLDENYGPKNHGCPQCRGLLSVDQVAGTHEILRNPEFYALAHLSHYVQPGASRLILDNGQLAFKNPNGSVVILIKNNAGESRVYSFLTNGCRTVNIKVPAWSTMTVKLPADG